ncbi:MAG: hypothetical protein ACW99E_21850 [Promethearchaeota archaeon]|jgi:hypothetical protein
MISRPKNQSHHSIRCGICRRIIEDRAQIYQAGISWGVLCIDCYKNFSSEDIELMTNMFIAYGGYFGKRKGSDFSTNKVLKKILSELQLQRKKVNVEGLNLKMLHRALLYGITPKQYVKSLQSLMK